jgi:DNA-binding MarR family transcriptional regulator
MSSAHTIETFKRTVKRKPTAEEEKAFEIVTEVACRAMQDEHGVNRLQLLVLSWVLDDYQLATGTIRRDDAAMAREFNCDPSVVSNAVDHLINRGYLVVSADPLTLTVGGCNG